jgi:hypothetical protein
MRPNHCNHQKHLKNESEALHVLVDKIIASLRTN